jgi:Holliday junction resolvase RusA-like endonuclease
MPWKLVFKTVIYGHAEPAGSKRPVTPKHGGRAFVIDANPKAAKWKKQIAQIVGEKYRGPLLDCPLMAQFVFYRVRPGNHFGSGRNAGKLKASADRFPLPAPDVLKTARAVEDALQGVVYVNDSRIVSEVLHKRWGPREAVLIEISKWEDRGKP